MGRITAVFGQHDEKTMAQLQDVASRAVQTAIMADGHLGYVMPIGGVAAYDNKVSVVGVGFDIACGNAAIRTDMTLDRITDNSLTISDITANPFRATQDRQLIALANEINNTISFGIGRKNEADDAPVDHALFHDAAWWAVPNIGSYRDDLIEKARRQLGTVGSGNHYVDVFVDEENRIWVGVHFGSRGLGHTIATQFLNLSQGLDWGARGAKEVEVLLDLNTPLGHDYFELMRLAGDYAYAGREWVARKVVQMLGGNEVELVHNHHNFAWKEQQWVSDEDGNRWEELVVIRKGATPAFPGQRGFIGGSMGDNAVIVSGAHGYRPGGTFYSNPEILDVQKSAMFSTVHGAGRVMSRTAAAGKRNRKTGTVITPGLVTDVGMKEWLADAGVILRGGGLDEAPQAYRRLPEVLAAQGPTIKVEHSLKPVVVVMAGAREFDPYKD